MKNSVRFSVIIPLYNKQSYIEKAIDSVLNQTFKEFELIVIDDCSTDQSLEVVKKIKDPRIRIIQHKKNKGLSASRNTGIRNAQNDFLAFLDADDIWKPDFLDKIFLLIQEYFPKASLFASKFEIALSNQKIRIYPFKELPFKTHGILGDFFSLNIGYTYYCPSSLCVHKSVFEDVGYYNESITFSEDVDFNIRAHLKYQMAYYNECLVTYLLESENQITRTSLKGKTIPDYDFYEQQNPQHESLKKYLDFQRYVKAKLFKLANDRKQYDLLKKGINFKNLSWKQRLLLKTPNILLRILSKGKQKLQQWGWIYSSY